MLERESFGSGWRVSLRPRGFGRFVVAAFLGVWLCGWAAGELFAGGTLLAGLRELLAPGLELAWLPRMKNAVPANAWPVLAFLAFWLTFWTFGGVFAMVQVARSLAGLDEIRWDGEGVEVVRRVGPFASRRRVAWSATSEVFAQRRGSLVLHTGRGLASVTAFGDGEERRQLALWLSEAWRQSRGGESEAREAAEQAPAGWTIETGEDGRPFLAGARWLGLGRVELRPVPRGLRRVRRFLGREWTRELAPARLRLESSRDSDGDERWTLVASGPDGTLNLASDLHAPGAARRMGLWLAARMGIELEGRPESGDEVRRRAG